MSFLKYLDGNISQRSAPVSVLVGISADECSNAAFTVTRAGVLLERHAGESCNMVAVIMQYSRLGFRVISLACKPLNADAATWNW